MYTLDLEKLPPEIQAKLLSDKAVIKEIKQLGTPGGATARKLIFYSERGLISPPVAGRSGGKSKKRGWLPWTGSEYDASVRLTSRLSLNTVAEVCGLAGILWACRDFRDVLGHSSDFRGKEALEPYIVYWMAIFAADLKLLYGDFLQRERLDYFQSEAFKVVVMGLTHRLYDGYIVDPDGNLVRTKAKALPDPESSLKSFPPERPTMAAKSRE